MTARNVIILDAPSNLGLRPRRMASYLAAISYFGRFVIANCWRPSRLMMEAVWCRRDTVPSGNQATQIVMLKALQATRFAWQTASNPS